MYFDINTLLLSASGMSLLERLKYGGKVFIIGVVTVFAVLSILWGAISLFKIFMYDIPQRNARKKAEMELAAHISVGQSEKAVTYAAPEPEIPTASSISTDDNGEILAAVIAAAVAAYNADCGGAADSSSALPFRVVSYRRVKGANGWSGAADSQTF